MAFGFRNFGATPWKTTAVEFPRAGRPTPDWAHIRVYREGRLVDRFPGGVGIFRNQPFQRPLIKPWQRTPPSARQLDLAARFDARRAADQARRQAEQAEARMRAEREARERASREARERARHDAVERAARRAREQAADRARQRDAHERAIHDAQRRLRELHALQDRARAGRAPSSRPGAPAWGWLGDMLAGSVPPAFRRWAIRRPLDDVMTGARGPDLVFAQANRAARQVQLGMEDFSFWVQQAASVVTEALGAVGGVMTVAGARLATTGLRGSVGSLVRRQVANGSARLAKEAVGQSVDQVLMSARDEAYRIASRLVRQDLAGGSPTTPQRFGEIVDALFKSLVQDARNRGLVPATIRTAPPPLAISGRRLPIGGAVDVWDTATGVGWDVMKARGSQLVKHDKTYLLGHLKRDGTVIPPRTTMPDGTVLHDVRPLVYPRGNPGR